MGHVKHATQLVLQTVADEVSRRDAAAGQVVMGQAARPHDLRPGLQILRLPVQDAGLSHHGAKQPLGQTVGEFEVAAIDKIALHGVHHDVRAAAHALVIRQGEGEARVHDGKARAGDVVVIAALVARVLLGEDGAVAGLGAGGGDGEDGAHGQHRLGRAGMGIELPHVLVRLAHAVGDGLGRVDHGAAADGQQKVRVHLLPQDDALVDLADARIGHHAAQRGVADACLLQRHQHLHQQAALDRALAAVDDQRVSAAEAAHAVPDLLHRAGAEEHLGGGVIDKVVHGISPLCLYWPYLIMIAPKRKGLPLERQPRRKTKLLEGDQDVGDSHGGHQQRVQAGRRPAVAGALIEIAGDDCRNGQGRHHGDQHDAGQGDHLRDALSVAMHDSRYWWEKEES